MHLQYLQIWQTGLVHVRSKKVMKLFLVFICVASLCQSQSSQSPDINYPCACLTLDQGEQPCCPHVSSFLSLDTTHLEMTLDITMNLSNWHFFTENTVFDVRIIECTSSYCSPYLVTAETHLRTVMLCSGSASVGDNVTVLINCPESVMEERKVASLLTFGFANMRSEHQPIAVFIMHGMK